MKIAVCDDEKIFRNDLIRLLDLYCTERGQVILTDEYDDGSKLLKSPISYDIILLDHQMEFLSGLDTIKALREKNNSTKVVFVSSYSEIVFDSMKYNAFRFLVKPVEKEKLFEAIDEAIKELNSEFKIVVKDTEYNQSIVIPEKDIIYAQADNVCSIIETENGSYRYSYNLSYLEEELRSDFFMRIHRSYLVNFNHITSFDKSGVVLSNGHKAVISRNNYKDFSNYYLNYIKSSRGGN
ncbi:MAG: response regulator transcription factor [Ruminococcus sp.]|nr:response regulator transcription factor [Ruminococcus sp.]